jgi:hypothetical protein
MLIIYPKWVQESSMKIDKKNFRKKMIAVTGIIFLGTAGIYANAQTQSSTQAQAQAEVIRLRGTVESIQGGTMILRGRNGETLNVDVPEKIGVQEMYTIEFADIKAGAIVGSTALAKSDGSLVALEIHMFPEGSGGPAEGQRASDLQTGSILTNGHVLSTVTTDHKRQLKLSSKNEEITIGVPDGIPIVTYRPGDISLLKPGAKVYLHTTQLGENHYKAGSATVGANGLMPPL